MPYFFFFPLSSTSILVPSAYPFPQKSFLFIEPIERSVYSKYSYYRYSSKQIFCSPGFFVPCNLTGKASLKTSSVSVGSRRSLAHYSAFLTVMFLFLLDQKEDGNLT